MPEKHADAQPFVEHAARTAPREVALDGRRVVPEIFFVDRARAQCRRDERIVGPDAQMQVAGEADRVDLDIDVRRAAQVDATLQRRRQAPADHQTAGAECGQAVASGKRGEVGDAGTGPAGRRAGQAESCHEPCHVDGAAIGHGGLVASGNAQAMQAGFKEAAQELAIGVVVRQPIDGGAEKIVRENDMVEA
ncbi:MAG: hypothetical protein H7306_20450 [Bacteriovorax sp.]|nr:hypothetical protein [Rhizobacter sp.]